jgi:hypothetical protein
VTETNETFTGVVKFYAMYRPPSPAGETERLDAVVMLRVLAAYL